MARQKFLFINKASPLHPGGAEIRSWEVARRLVRMGYAVIWVGAKTSVQERVSELRDNVRVISVPTLPDFVLKRFEPTSHVVLAWSCLMLMGTIRSLLGAERFDAVREDWSPFPPSFILPLRHYRGPRRLAIIHNHPACFAAWQASYGLLPGIAGFLAARWTHPPLGAYHHVICANRTDFERLRRCTPPSRIHFIPNGVDLESLSPGRADAPREDGPVRLLFAGRLVAAKGGEHLLRALHILNDTRGAPFTCTIAGSGPDEKRLRELAGILGLGSRVRFRGHVPHEEMAALYHSHDILVHPSISEGHPLTILEAFAAGLPVVASDLPAIREMGPSPALNLVEPGSAENLAAALAAALASTAFRTSAGKTSAQVAGIRSWDVVAREELVCLLS